MIGWHAGTFNYTVCLPLGSWFGLPCRLLLGRPNKQEISRPFDDDDDDDERMSFIVAYIVLSLKDTCHYTCTKSHVVVGRDVNEARVSWGQGRGQKKSCEAEANIYEAEAMRPVTTMHLHSTNKNLFSLTLKIKLLHQNWENELGLSGVIDK